MIINDKALLAKAPIANMETTKQRLHGVSYGLSEAGYDIRLAQTVTFSPSLHGNMHQSVNSGPITLSRFALASAQEYFQMPDDLIGRVCDKSTWARKGVSVFNTVIEPGWKGYLTLELVYHGDDFLELPAGAGIAQVLFSEIKLTKAYTGKYQDQDNRPVASIMEPDTVTA